jgi:hypothetical protein
MRTTPEKREIDQSPTISSPTNSPQMMKIGEKVDQSSSLVASRHA